MKTLEYTYDDVDKTEWGEGPWVDEHDKVQFLDEETGLPCIIKRGPMGAWCGYVGVSEGHPAYKKHYDEVHDMFPDWDEEGHLEVHGGLTFAGPCQPHDLGDEVHAICHVVEDGEDDHVWWLGFDCAHGWDLMPHVRAANRRRYEETGDELWNDLNKNPRDETYRDQAYVTKEVRQLAKQLAAM
jgi:hypothetical protein